ncbi:hypothetical protein [Aquabacterium sp. OR-4]|uniref:hypothetical protein n=1 Tax=Aquabacterium sp. OR-4 TaxID=2978127 RepID=UPI0021B239E4|nr:hypothetical protein [Aquabacterium sp. OR-4]MDT7836449.1 hypothetical protein [Aquabacterium sp. OR-4]
MRILSADELAALQAPVVRMAVLVQMELTSTVRLNTSGLDLEVGGAVWYGTRGLGRIDAVTEAVADIKPLGFELSGVSSAAVSMALNEPVRNRAISVYSLLFHPVSNAPLTPRLRWQGRGDAMVLREEGGAAVIQVSAEHCAMDLLRGVPSYWSDTEQRRLYGNDPSLQYMSDQVDQQIQWPAASFFRK